MDDQALRLRLDVDVRGTDEVGLGAMRSGPPGPPVRDGEAAVVLATELARAALATLPPARRASVARDLVAIEASDAAADLAARRVPGADVRDLRPEEQVGARGWCARAVLGDGLAPAAALLSVDAIRLPDGEWTADWAARVPWMTPALVRRIAGDAPDALARMVIALRALGEEVVANPASADDPATAARAASAALAVPRPVPGAQAFAPAAAPSPEAVTAPVRRAPTAAAPAPAAPRPAPAAPDRRLVVALATSIGIAVLALVLVFAIIGSPGSFGIASTSDVNERLSLVEAGVTQLRGDVGTLAQRIDSGGGTPADQLSALRDEVVRLRQEVEQLCSVLPVVC
ncbi:MAG: hypothetical protein ACKORG_07295 [Actinomycetota bacterium]